jgi:glycosyltransferase involved in cell wall biosynthesis
MKITAVVITKDRPIQLKRLIDSVLDSKIPSLSLVLIDDSTRENFERTKNFLLPHSDICEHRSSLEVRKEIESILKKMRLPRAQKSLIETCFGLKSPFRDFAKSLSKVFLFRKKFFTLFSRSFSPYSTARNLGIYHTYRVFNPEEIVFLDDDCYIKRPERLMAALQLIGKKVDGKEIVAVSGLYEDLALSIRRRRHPYEEPTPTSILTGMNSFLKRSFLTEQEQRLTIMPYHALGGALILSKKVFLSLPFDPFIPRGEDHAYCLDLKARYGKDFAIVRDNLFIVQHNSNAEGPQNLEEINALRDIFRFVYLHFKVGQCFIPYFTIRWALNALIHMSLQPSKSKQRLFELWALVFLARVYANRKANRYSEIAEAWKSFLNRIVA